jgi:hypothetical protein
MLAHRWKLRKVGNKSFSLLFADLFNKTIRSDQQPYWLLWCQCSCVAGSRSSPRPDAVFAL